MDSSQIVAAKRQKLRAALRRWRRRKKESQQQAADAMGWSLSKLVRLEAGSGRPKPSDVLALLAHYDAPREEIDELTEVARDLSREKTLEEKHKGLYAPAYLRFLEFEQAATHERQWHPNVIPGMLQTEEYAQEVITKMMKGEGPIVRQMIDARMERQELLRFENGPRFCFLLDESILLRPVGDKGLMQAQADKILELNALEHVSVKLVPLNVGLHPGMRGPFILLEFDDDESADVLYMETPRGEFFARDKPAITKEYKDMFRELEGKAVTNDEMLSRVERALQRARKTA